MRDSSLRVGAVVLACFLSSVPVPALGATTASVHVVGVDAYGNTLGVVSALVNLGGQGLSPTILLAAIYDGDDDFGGISWGRLPQYDRANVQQGIAPPPSGSPIAIITLNNNIFGPWFTTSALNQAAVLLHELGHAYQFIYGPASTLTQGPDGGNSPKDLQRQASNNALISKNCGGTL
jgi:hypothetical protein